MPGFNQSVVAPASMQASVIANLWWLMFWVATGVFICVLGFIAVAVARSRRATSASEGDARLLGRSVVAGVALTAAVLVALLVASIFTGRAASPLHASGAVTIEVIGHQWWWEIQYADPVPERRVTTANEIHLPVGRPVVFQVTSRDVIHSLWIPNLQGKRDLIPGYTTAIGFQAERAGTFRGQCAEFCGLQHAHMALDVVAEPEAEFAQWLERNRRPAPEPFEPRIGHGRDVFMAARCATCHTVRGTAANGLVGPDLTHIASRISLGAGSLPNTPQYLAAWIRDPHSAKPGNQMPPNPLPPDDLAALVEYLGTLR